MTATSSLTSEERWNIWEQRGRDNDARVRRGFRRAALSLLIAMAVLLLVWFVR